MATYEYNCQDCETGFELSRSIAEPSNTNDIRPECGSRRVERKYSHAFAKMSKKS